MAKIVNKYQPELDDGWSSLTASSRYRRLFVLQTDTSEEYIETRDTITIPESQADQYYEVEVSTEDRLDLISHKFYNTPLLWWVIADASGIYNPLRIPKGTLLRIPPKSSLYGFGGLLL